MNALQAQLDDITPLKFYSSQREKVYFTGNELVSKDSNIKLLTEALAFRRSLGPVSRATERRFKRSISYLKTERKFW